MAKLNYGEMDGRDTRLTPSATAIIFDALRENVLLAQMSDNGRWCLPGGGMDPGESAEEACILETMEETVLDVRVTRLVGIYTSPDLVVYQRSHRSNATSRQLPRPQMNEPEYDHDVVFNEVLRRQVD